MTTRRFALVLAVGALSAGCQPARSDNDRTAALEKRIAELEQALAASPSPAPGAAAAPQGSAGARAQTPVAKPGPQARSARSRARTTGAAAPATAPRQATPVASADEFGPDVGDDARATAADFEPARRDARRLVVPAGTSLALVLETPLSSVDSRVGDPVTARVQRAEDPDGDVALPGGARLRGRVIEAQRAGRVKGRARLSVAFDEIVVRGRGYGIDAAPLVVEAAGSGKRDAAIVGGTAVAGGVIGAIAGGKGGFGKGVLVGAGAGTGAVLATRGQEVDLPTGTRAAVKLRSRLVL